MTQEHSLANGATAHATHSSYWPVVLAATLTITLVGVVVHPAMIVLGAVLSVAAIIAWGVQRFEGPPATSSIDAEGLGEREVGRTTPATATRGLAWWGLVWFIASEAVFFANLIAAYLYLRVTSAVWPPSGTPHLELLLPSIGTVVLLLSGLPAYYAEKAIQRGDRKGLQIGLVLAALLGTLFLGGQLYEYVTVGFTPETNIFSASFFALTGFHGAHVAVGIAFLLTILGMSVRGHFSSKSHFAVIAAGTYWHFVDVVWIFLFALLYLIR